MRRVDVAIVGAGPAGLAAAARLAQADVSIALLDEQRAAGGQIYRGVGEVPAARAALLGADYLAGRSLLAALSSPQVSHLTGATIWEVTPDGAIAYSRRGRAAELEAGRVIVATGALERPMPFPGWTLPGVMTAGAAQILLKTAGLLPPTPTVLAGSGPLLYLLANQLVAMGHEIAALVDTTPADTRAAALRHAVGAARGWRTLAKGLRLLRGIKAAGVRHLKGARDLCAEGEGSVERLAFTAGGRRESLACAAVLVHNGVVPNVQITRSLNLEHEWDALQCAWRPRLDPDGRTSEPKILVAGDGGGIAGADAAVPSGQLAALAALADLGRLDASRVEPEQAAARAELRRLTAVRPFLDALYAPAEAFLDPPDETIVCRCEEVTAAELRGFVDLGCLGPNQAKSYGRSGMGPCQGRYCGPTVSAIIARRRGVPIEAVGAFRVRPPLKPVTLKELAAMAESGSAGGGDATEPAA